MFIASRGLYHITAEVLLGALQFWITKFPRNPKLIVDIFIKWKTREAMDPTSVIFKYPERLTSCFLGKLMQKPHRKE